jgi:hypothetical protein
MTHPKVFPLVASRPAEAPWLRPPLRSLAWVETFLTALMDEGFSEDGAVAAYRRTWTALPDEPPGRGVANLFGRGLG